MSTEFGPYPRLSPGQAASYNSSSATFYHGSPPAAMSKTLSASATSSSSVTGGGGGGVSRCSGLPTCTHCTEPITDQYIFKVRGRVWHSRCAVCVVCGCGLNETCFVLGGQLYCRQDYHRLYATRCATCKQPMLSHELCMRTTGGEVHHVSCFVCSVCRAPLATGQEYRHEPGSGAPVCRPCTTAALVGVTGDRRKGSGRPPCSAAPGGGGGGGGKRGRTTLSAEQRERLQLFFETNQRPSKRVRESLAEEFGLPVRVVQVWFQNARAREKKLSATSITSSCSPSNHHPPPSAAAAPPPPPPPQQPPFHPGMKKTQLHQWNDMSNLQQQQQQHWHQ